MSFLTEITFRRVASAAPRFSATTFAPRVTTASSIHRRQLSNTAPQYKTVTEAAKDTLKSVDRAVSDKLVDGINLGSAVADKAKEAGQNITSGKVAGKAEELRDDLASKAKYAKDEAASKAEDFKQEASSKAQGFKQEASSKAQDLKQDAKEKTRQAADQTSDTAQQAAHEVKKRT